MANEKLRLWPEYAFMVFRKIYLLVLGTFCLGIVACAHRTSSDSYVVLSYFESPGMCENCPRFRIDFHSHGVVDFHGLRACAVPGLQQYRIPVAKFLGLVQAFQHSHFFDIPRLDTKHQVVDAGTIILSYKDERRVHETVDTGRLLPRLKDLEKKIREAAEAERFLKPSIALYQDLLGSGWDINTLGEDHENALTSVVGLGSLDSVRFLQQHGAVVSKKALLDSAFSNNVQMVELLLAARRTDMRSPEAQQLMVRAARSADIVRLLLAKGADINSRDRDTGETPLMAAVSAGSLDSVRVLLTNGADPNAADNSGRSALWFATDQTNSGFITFLAESGASINAQDRSGRTALMNASDLCWDWNIKALLTAGADPRITDRRGRTALQPDLVTSPNDPKCKTSRQLLESAINKRTARQ